MNWQRHVRNSVLAVALAAAGGVVMAAPAPWYWWSSLHDGQRVCAQVMPSQGWKRAEGPFNNAQCQARPAALFPHRTTLR